MNAVLMDDATRLVERTEALRFYILRGRTVGADPSATDTWAADMRGSLALEPTLHHRLRDETR